MSIYFVHFLINVLPLSVLMAFITPDKKYIVKSFLAIFLGFLFGYFAFFIAAQFLKTENLIFNFDFIFISCLLIAFVFYFWKKIEILNFILLGILSFCIALHYYFLSQDFPIFAGSLIDSEGIASLGFIILALMICILNFFFLKWQKNFNPKTSFMLFLFLVLIESDKALANILLTLMRNSIIDTHTFLVSFVGKSNYFGFFGIYVYLFFITLLAFLSLTKRQKNIQKNKILDINFRKNEARTSLINRYFSSVFISCVVSFCIILYFFMVSSKPLTLDEPKEILPDNNGKFIFDIALLRDNKLHRFAYISAEGKVIRFFLINKREDKDSPVAVFDACMICGDMGYIKKDGELICISCNVRIFLPSVGKSGGCNPIPLKYEYDGKKISIDVKDVIAGSNYFNQIKEIEVEDPVSKSKVINTQAPFSYSYKGITYYFSNEKNYEEFKKDPMKYVEENEAQFLIQRRNDVS
ncbi:Fe-S-containing protein [Campylobacter sp. VTCC 70190]|uniref:Fe-S-containing protein n=1 Tax=Campylobacter sp. VTCC 70190 TaxID=3392118 RepID=UPI00398F8991